MKVLITSSRLPHALGEIRKLGEAGHEVYATDTFRTAPGSHSHHVKKSFLTASPTFATRQFIDDLKEIITQESIDLLVPSFEEVFYIAKHQAELEALTQVFCSSFETLARLHNKQQFAELTRELALPMPETRAVTSQDDLRAATEAFGAYFARAVYSRGGVTLLTNTGPLAGHIKLEECHPTHDQPWVVSAFVPGEDICSMSVAQHGRLVAHCAYHHPKTIEHAGGIEFESLDEPQSLEIARTYIEALNYHGQISFDYLKTDDGLSLVECNPRPTAAVFMMDSKVLSDAVFDPPACPVVVRAGAREQISVAILRDMFREPKDIPSDLRSLLSGTEDVYSQKGDRLPGLYQILSYTHVLAFRHRMHVRRHKHSDIMEAQFFDIGWDGGEIA